MATVYDSDDPSAPEESSAMAQLATANDITVLSQNAVTTTQTDLSTVASKLAQENPNAIAMEFVGAQYVTLIEELNQDGWKGTIFAQPGAVGALAPAGALANGVIFPTDYLETAATGAVATKFASLYEAKYKSEPTDFAAEAYDAVWFVARAIKSSGSATRAGILKGLQTIAAKGFQGAEGHITFVARTERVTPLLVEWENGSLVGVK
jgi:branched-chain amino acid transport system substrate-binding protein